MKILITGGAGYIGSHTIKELRKVGYHDLVVIDDLSSGQKERIPAGIKTIEGDFADEKILDLAIGGVDVVIHFAALKSAPESIEKPEKYYENNVGKSIRLLTRCLKEKVKYFIFSSSAAVYGDVNGFPITEEFTTSPVNPYGWTKLMFEQILEDVSKASDINHVCLRYFNAGGADPEGKLGNDHKKGEDVLSVLIRRAKEEGEFTIFGNDYDTADGTAIRDMIHVTDLAMAHIAALHYLENGGKSVVLNLGSDKGYTIKEIAEKTKKITGSNFTIKEGGRRDGDIVVSIASSKMAKAKLSWEPKFGIDDVIETAWNWEEKVH